MSAGVLGGGAVANLSPGTPIDTVGSAAVGAAGSAQITGVPGRTAYVTGFSVTWDATGTGAVTDTLTLAPTATGFNSLSYKVTTVAGSGGCLQMTYPHPIACQTVGGTIALALTGVANRAPATIVLHGFYL